MSPATIASLTAWRWLVPGPLAGTERCPECNGYGSSLMEETDRCTRGGGSGLVVVVNPAAEGPNGDEPARLGQQE